MSALFNDAWVQASGLTRLVHLPEVTSTMDVAHALAADGAPAGTLVLADRQRLGRGRAGKVWISDDGAGIWCTLIERPDDASALSVLSLRVGLALAEALDACVASPVRLKWPNDLYVGDGKLGGVLIEVRWHGARPEWVAIGVGINRRVPEGTVDPTIRGAAVRDAEPLATLLPLVVRAMRSAAGRRGLLTAQELDGWHARDLARGRRITAPIPGIVSSLTSDGGLVVAAEGGVVRTLHSGSLLFA